MFGFRNKENRKCFGCGNRLFEDGINLLMSNKEVEHCHRCSGYITRRGVLGHLIREKRDLQQQYNSVQAFNEQLKCALQRKREALDQAIDDIEISKASPKVAETPDKAAGATPEKREAPEDSAEYIERLLNSGPPVARATSSRLSAFQAPQSLSPLGSSSLQPLIAPAPAAQQAGSPDSRTHKWVQQTGALVARDARTASDEVVKSESSGGPQDPTAEKHTRAPKITTLAPTPTLAQTIPPEASRRSSLEASMELRDENQPPSPTYSGSARGTNYTGFTQMSGLESRASMSDRGSERSYCSSRPSSVMSHPMQTLKHSRNVRAAIADDISFLDDLIKTYKKAPKREESKPTEAPAPPPPAPTHVAGDAGA